VRGDEPCRRFAEKAAILAMPAAEPHELCGGCHIESGVDADGNVVGI
jgi:hypothetical protein